MAVKNRLLYLMQFLQENSDENRPVSTPEIRSVLEKQGFQVTVPTLRTDIESLRSAGYEIQANEKEGLPTTYSWLDRKWDPPELQVLIDAVGSAQFIPETKSRELIAELCAMAGPSHRESLQPGILISEHIKAKNKNMIYTVQAVQRAIKNDRKITFRYLRYTQDKKQVPKHSGTSGEEYVVSPYATVWNNDRYYLVGWSDKRQKVATFRIDRMMVPKQLPGKRVPPPEDFDVRDYVDKVFWMFDGPKEDVTLRCRTGILDQVIDRFGEGVELKIRDSATFDVTVPVSVSATFYAWVFQFTGEMAVIAPEYVREKYAEMLQEAIDVALG